MSRVTGSREVTVELEQKEKETLVSAYKILKNVNKGIWQEELDGTEEDYITSGAMESLGEFLRHFGIDDGEGNR